MELPVTCENVTNLDFSKVTALQQKRTLAFVNHFVTTTVRFLNSFTRRCEEKLMEFERKLEKVEASLILLESRLSSIPEANTEVKSKESHPETIKNSVIDHSFNAENTEEGTLLTNDIKSDEPQEIPAGYEKFIKMVQVGVPLEAVKLKVSLEGLDPDILIKIICK